MKRNVIVLLLMAGWIFSAAPVWAWGQKGHRIIAQVAYGHLSKKAHRQVDSLLGTNGMIYWANWADEIKSDTIYQESIREGWHYQDLEGGLSDEQVVDMLSRYPSQGGNLFRVMDSLNTAKDDEITLRMIVHLTGDRFCPMHMGHIDDLGGNRIKMAWFSRSDNTNLHAVWDDKLIESQGYSYTEYAQYLEDTYGAQRKAIEDASWADLTLQTYHLTSDIYAYHPTWDGNSYHYVYRWRKPMEYQLYCAGIRLAKILNERYH